MIGCLNSVTQLDKQSRVSCIFSCVDVYAVVKRALDFTSYLIHLISFNSNASLSNLTKKCSAVKCLLVHDDEEMQGVHLESSQ